MKNPLTEQLYQYRRLVVYLSLLFCVIWVYMTTYYNVPELNYAQILGASYLPYVITSAILLMSFIGLWIAVGMTLQMWLQKKAVDLSLEQLGDMNGLFSKKENEEE